MYLGISPALPSLAHIGLWAGHTPLCTSVSSSVKWGRGQELDLLSVSPTLNIPEPRCDFCYIQTPPVLLFIPFLITIYIIY